MQGVGVLSGDRLWKNARRLRMCRGNSLHRVWRIRGYYDTEHTKNVRDWKEVFDYNIEEPTNDKEVTAEWSNLWPEYPPEFR